MYQRDISQTYPVEPMQTETIATKSTRPGIEQQRAKVLEAAVELFSADGTAAVSISAICKRAGVSRDTYYRCFANKDTLIEHLYQTTVSEHMLTGLGSSDLHYDNPEWIHEVVEATVDAILAQHKVAQFVFVESTNPNSRAYEVIDAAFDHVARLMQTWCLDNYGSSPTRGCFKGVLVGSQWLVQHAIVTGMADKEIRVAKKSIEQLFAATFRGLKP